MNENKDVKDNVKSVQESRSVEEIKLEQPKDSYGIAALLAETLEAAVFADCSASMKACQLIEQYAYGADVYYSNEDWTSDDQQVPSMHMVENVNSYELKMINIDVADGDGGSKTISVPQITMMPLPLLHITEATFNMDFSLELIKNEVSEDKASMDTKSIVSSRSVQVSKEEQNLKVIRELRKQKELYSSYNNRGTRMKVSDSTSTNNASRIHMKIDVKMEQADLPEGFKAILQTAYNSMSINNNNVDNTVHVVESE